MIVRVILLKAYVVIYCTNVIELEYKEVDNKLYTKISIGSPLKEFNMKISNEGESSFIISKYNSTSLKRIGETKQNSLYPSYYCVSQDIFKIGDVNTEIYFYNTNNTSNKNILSLSLNLKDLNFSLVHNLKKDAFITKLQYAIIPHSKTKGKIIFGEFPIDIINKEINKCKVIFSQWGCKLKMFQIPLLSENYIVNNIHKSIFSLEERNISVPINIMNFFNFAIFFHYPKCIYVNRTYFKHFHCDCRFINDFPSIKLYFNEFYITLNKEQVFIKGKKYQCFFNIISTLENEAAMEIIFGRVIIEQFITVYDYENKEISFYPLPTMRTIGVNAYYSETLYKICFCFLFMGTILLIFSLKLY